ncbi:MAG: hypothetical protein ACLR23_05265 [Clostridia bacterium]
MKKATRLIALTMALLLAVGAGLTGCKKEETNSNSSSADSGNSSGDGQSTSTPETWEEITLNYWNLGNGEQKDSKRFGPRWTASCRNTFLTPASTGR